MADRRATTWAEWVKGLMASAALGFLGWIALSVAHIPIIDQKLEDFMATAKTTLSQHEIQLHDDNIKLTDHEIRIHDLEHKK